MNNFEKSKYTNANFLPDDKLDASLKDTSKKSFEEMKPEWRKACEFWKQYPDRFLDYIKPKDSKIDLYPYQRIMLRILFRYRKVYITATRGTAKSFTEILALYLRCIMFPEVKLFICAPGKEQASKIAKENIENIWSFFPLLKNEVEHATFGKDYTRLTFHNGSVMDVVQVEQSARGGRRHGGAVEEIVDEGLKKDTLNEVVIPLMANNRIASCGFKGKEWRIDPNEMHKSQYFITTAGTRQSFAFEKLQEILKEMAEGKSAFSLGSSYELPCMHGQLDINFINELKESDTYNPLSFAREYESVWTGSSDNSFVSLEDLKKCRTIERPEIKANDKDINEKKAMYVLAYDVSRAEGRANALCALAIIKIIPRSDGTYQKFLVNMYSFEGTHFLEQALFLKKMVNNWKASILVVDANGLGVGLVDQLVLEIDENPAYEVVNDDRYDRYKTGNSIPMVYNMKSQSKGHKDQEIDNLFSNLISNHKVKMLVTETHAKTLPAIQKMAKDRDKNGEKIAKELMPYTMVDLLQDEIMNLEHKQTGNDSKVIQISKRITKDKWSAFKYGLYWIHLLERKNAVKKRERADSWKFMAVRAPKKLF
jgi:hypothetical protein